MVTIRSHWRIQRSMLTKLAETTSRFTSHAIKLSPAQGSCRISWINVHFFGCGNRSLANFLMNLLKELCLVLPFPRHQHLALDSSAIIISSITIPPISVQELFSEYRRGPCWPVVRSACRWMCASLQLEPTWRWDFSPVVGSHLDWSPLVNWGSA